jgi:hypothetical protein
MQTYGLGESTAVIIHNISNYEAHFIEEGQFKYISTPAA